MAPNYSIYSIPLYYVLTLSPHLYSTVLISRTSHKIWDNRNPRGASQSQSIQKSVPQPTYLVYERARACHNNGMENMALFIAAIVLGNMANLENGTLNWGAGTFLELRALYTVAYIKIESKKGSFARTAVWAAGVMVCLVMIVKAGGAIARASEL
jgi:uncharacterized MAPEG superfamily protein